MIVVLIMIYTSLGVGLLSWQGIMLVVASMIGSAGINHPFYCGCCCGWLLILDLAGDYI